MRVPGLMFGVIASVLGFGSFAYAKSSLQRLEAQLEKLAPPSRPTKVEHCANFSGLWKGACKDESGNTYEEEMIIDQEQCHRILIDGEFYRIGAQQSHNTSSSETFLDYKTDIGWNSGQTGLLNHYYIYVRPFQATGYSRATVEGSYKYSLIGEKLTTFNQSVLKVVSTDSIMEKNFWEECQFEKVDR